MSREISQMSYTGDPTSKTCQSCINARKSLNTATVANRYAADEDATAH